MRGTFSYLATQVLHTVMQLPEVRKYIPITVHLGCEQWFDVLLELIQDVEPGLEWGFSAVTDAVRLRTTPVKRDDLCCQALQLLQVCLAPLCAKVMVDFPKMLTCTRPGSSWRQLQN